MRNDEDLQDLLGASLVRVWSPDHGYTVGAGTLLTGTQVLTCAHVANFACGAREGAQDQPTGPVLVDFPFSDDHTGFDADVTTWVPIDEDGGGDLCVLTLRREAPVDCAPAQLLHVERLHGHEFGVLGFPGDSSGEQASGVLVGRNAGGLVQMQDVLPTGPGVRAGYSGAPVWDRDERGIVGVTVLADPDASTKTAYLIPSGLALEQVEAAGHRAPAEETTRHPSTGSTIRATVPVGCRVDCVLPSPQARGEADGWSLEAEEGGLGLVERPVGTVFVTLDATRVSSHRAWATSSASPDSCVSVRITVDATTPAPLTRWPSAPDEHDVRASLQDWAHGSALVPDRLFDGELTMTYRPVVRLTVTHLHQTRSTQRISCADEPTLEEYFEPPIETAEVELAPWDDDEWEGVCNRSVKRQKCADCVDGRVLCRTCHGSAKVRCERQVRCSACKGAGHVVAGGERVLCTTCGGRRHLVCPDCRGTGSHECLDCLSGRAACRSCGGDGWRAEFIKGSVVQVAEVSIIASPWPDGLPHLKGSDFVPLAVKGASGLQALPPDVRGQVAAGVAEEMGPWRSNEVMRKLEVGVAPAVVVSYHRGRRSDTALVVGSRVKAPRARRPGLWQVEERLGPRFTGLQQPEAVTTARHRLAAALSRRAAHVDDRPPGPRTSQEALGDDTEREVVLRRIRDLLVRRAEQLSGCEPTAGDREAARPDLG